MGLACISMGTRNMYTAQVGEAFYKTATLKTKNTTAPESDRR